MRTITSLALLAALGGGLAASPASAKHGADDPAGHVRHSGDDNSNHRRGGKSARKGRAAHESGHKRRGRGSDDGAGHR
jgi:hypothetical protein